MGGILVLVVFGLLALSAANGGSLAADGDNLATCDGVVAVAAGGGIAQVPGETGLFGTSESTACEIEAGQGDEDAVVVLQNALVRCNGQTVAVDGEYGPETTRAVIAVQRQAGVAADGAYGPATLQAMRWPTTASTTSAATDCARVSPVADAESPSASLP